MKNIVVTFFALFLLNFCFSQSEKAESLLNEGITLHDKAEYEAAIKKYDEAIALDANFAEAYYEKCFSLYTSKKLEECITLSKFTIQKFRGNPILKNIYVQYGSTLDDLGRSDEALKVYDEGLQQFPAYYLLDFNKGITYLKLKDETKAYNYFKDALVSNPFHSSSYFRVFNLLKNSNHIPAMMSCIMYLILDGKTTRADMAFKTLDELMNSRVKKNGDNGITITMDPSMLDDKKTKNEPDNFRMQETLFSLTAALDKDSAISSVTKTEPDKFDLKFQILINSLNESGKGFFTERYVPFFKALKEKNYTTIVSHLVYAPAKDERNIAWLKTNSDKIDAFYKWLKAYHWPEK